MVAFIDTHTDGIAHPRRPRNHEIIAVIPAYNAEKTIVDVVRKVRQRAGRCIVVDDGCTDGTAQNALQAGAELIVHLSNRGKGAAIHSAFAHLKSQEFQYAVLLDADGQHDPAEIPLFVQKARQENADVVCGTRMRDPQGMSFGLWRRVKS